MCFFLMELSLYGTPFHNMPPVFQKQNHTMIDMLNKCLENPQVAELCDQQVDSAFL